MPDFKLPCRATVTQAAVDLPQNRHVDQKDGTDDSRITPHSCGHLNVNKGIKILGKRCSVQQMVLKQTGYPSIEE